MVNYNPTLNTTSTGVGAEIAALVMESEAFDYLNAPPDLDEDDPLPDLMSTSCLTWPTWTRGLVLEEDVGMDKRVGL